MPKFTSVGRLPAGVLLIAMRASRSEMKPSAPLLASSVEMLVVSPSSVSSAVVTTSTACVVGMATTLLANSEVSLKLL